LVARVTDSRLPGARGVDLVARVTDSRLPGARGVDLVARVTNSPMSAGVRTAVRVREVGREGRSRRSVAKVGQEVGRGDGSAAQLTRPVKRH
jgi:hypothetical protein